MGVANIYSIYHVITKLASSQEVNSEREIFSCPICLDVLKDPVTVPVKNTTLAAVAEELKKTGLQDLAGRWHAGSKDVACDVCTGRNMKAVKTYLDCLVSFCEKHLQPHHQMAPLTEHKLVEPCQNLQENMCASHNEVKTMFCGTHQQCVCFLCWVENHQGHDVVSAAAERRDK